MKIINFKKTYKAATIQFPYLDTQARVVLLVGANGSGKSTLLKAMANLLTYEGTLEVNKDALYIQESIDYPESMTPKAYLEGVRSIGGGCKQRYEDLIKRFAMAPHLDKPFKSCSKGMKQKVNLIQGLMEKRSCYLIDEPFSGLDMASKEVFVRYVKQSGERFICSTHDESLFKGTRAKVVQV